MKKNNKKNNIQRKNGISSSVPFSLGEVNKNINDLTNFKLKPSKEEIINKAFKFHSQGNIAEARKYYQYFITLGFTDYRVFSNYGLILKSLGKLEEAEIYIRKSIELKSDYANAHSNLGIILIELGKLQEAKLSQLKAIEIKPDFANAYYNLGNILIELGQFKEAEIYTHKVIDIDPNFAEAYCNLGIILKELDKLKEAEIATRKAIKLKPNFAEAHSNLGKLLIDLDKSKEAEIATRKAIKLKPDFAEAHSNLGNILISQGQLKEAENSIREAIKLKPNYAKAHSNLGLILKEFGELKEAELSTREAIRLNPDFSEAHSNLALILLKIKKFPEAWKEYEWRTEKSKQIESIMNQSHLKQPEWKTNDKGRVFLWGEQGLGDQILFSSLIPEFLKEVDQLIIDVDERLIPIFRRSFDGNIVYNNQNNVKEKEYDFHISIASLPQFFRNELKNFPTSLKPFLRADQNKTNFIKNKLKNSKHDKIVGISWKSASKISKNKSLSLEEFILGIYSQNISFLNLQYGETKDEIDYIKEKHGINILEINDVDIFNNIDDFSSLINACDDIVSIDNVTAILAGAIGANCHLLLQTNSHWYWGVNDNKSYWLPSLILYRQKTFKSWNEPLKAIKETLSSDN